MHRPGPIGKIPEYASNKFHPENRLRRGEIVDRILDDSYGVLVYQEQINEILRQVGGFSLIEAESVRRLMSKLHSDRLDESRCRFLVNGMSKGISRNELSRLWDFLYEAASIAFMKAHAVAYGMISYFSAYLKTYALKANGNRLDNIYMEVYKKYYPDEER